jgi:DNA repair photolyase
LSINTLDEKFKNDMDRASSIEDRINTLKTLHNEGIRTVLFMSPLFPEITNWKDIIERTKDFVDEYWFENLNLRGSYKPTIMNYIYNNYYELYNLYKQIYINGDKSYWNNLSEQIEVYCKQNNISDRNFFHHEQIRKNN